MIQFFINQYKAINLLVAIVILAGVYTFIEGRKEGFPAVGLDLITISTSYPGASADAVEQLITAEIESAIEDIEGAGKLESFSSEGRSIIQFEVDIDSGRSQEEIFDDIQVALDTVSLPEDANDPQAREIRFGRSSANILAGFVGEADPETLKALVRRFERDVRKLSGVSRVEFINSPDLHIWIEVNPERLRKYDLALSTVIAAIRARNVDMPAGSITISGTNFIVKTEAPYVLLEEIRETIIKSNDGGNRIILADIANVRYAHETLSSYRRSQGAAGIWARVYKSESGDAIDVSTGVKNLLAEYEANNVLPAGITATTGDDVSFYVKRRLAVLTSNATAGLLFVFLSLILFFNLRVTFWTMLGIPFSFCLGILVAYGLGMTLNLMTMFGLIIVVGMIVDDAIIIAENIYVYVEKGYSYYDAALLGTKEMLLPVVAIIATTTLAFLPLMTLPGVYGAVLGIIPKIVIITMLCSLVECLFILPGHLAHLRNRKLEHAPLESGLSRTTKKSRHWFQPVMRVYKNLLTRLLRRPGLTALFFLLTLGGLAYSLGKDLPYVFFPGRSQSMVINIETDVNNSLEATASIIDEAERRIREATEGESYLVDVVSTVGVTSRRGEPRYQSHLGYIRVYLDTSRKANDRDISAVIEESVKETPGLEKYTMRRRRGGPGSDGNPIDVYITGFQLDEILAASAEVETFMETLPNLSSISSSYQTGKSEIIVRPNEALAGEFDIPMGAIGTAMQSAFGEGASTTLRSLTGVPRDEGDIEIIVKYPEDELLTLRDVEQTLVLTEAGIPLPIGNLAEFEITTSSGQLTREDGTLFISINAALKDRASLEYGANEIFKLLREKFPTWEATYPSLNFALKGEKEEEDELNTATLRALLMAALSIFFVLTMIFRSYSQAFVVMSIIPLGFVGIIVGLAVSDTPLGLMPFLGGVALMGIVVNDSLVMIDKINRLRREGTLTREEAIVAGATARLRPILMTSITTIIGIAPLAYGFLGEEPFLAPMGIALMWGLIASTFLLLILLPSFYLLMERLMDVLTSWMGSIKKNIFRRT